MDAVPPLHVHTLRSHWRSLVVVGCTVVYWAAVHVEWLAHVPHASWASVGATFMYSSAPHTLTPVHCRSDDAVGAATWQVTPRLHTACAWQLVSRWLWVALNCPSGHAAHVRAWTTESCDMRSTCPHVGCAVQLVSRWLALVWNVSAGHAAQVRLAVLVSADMTWPAPHVGWATHEVSRCATWSW